MAANLIETFDWKDPQYEPVFAVRTERLRRIRSTPGAVDSLKAYYRDHIGQFIQDWGITSDPRNALVGRPVVMPFMLFPKQRECVDWMLELARSRQSGLIEKSRDCGCSWLAMCVAASLCLFNVNLNIGVGSAKADKVDRSGDPDCLFWKLRTFLKYLPPEFRGGWAEGQHSTYMRNVIPETGSTIVGESGDQIGRGGRTSMYLIDEAAHLERPKLIEASLASNTDTRIDISSVSGMANSFAEKRHSGRVKVFTFHWRDDPRKGPAWYASQQAKLDPVTLAAEVDIDYHASTQGTLIPTEWVQAAVGAAQKLGIKASGIKRGALDVADEGFDACAWCSRYGQLVETVQSWSGKGSDIMQTVVRAVALCDEYQHRTLVYDADGLGAGVRGDIRVINEQRRSDGREIILDEAYRGSSSPEDPEKEMVPGRTNKDMFANLKAMSWFSLRLRFQATHRALQGQTVNPDEIISINSGIPELGQLVQELSQPTYSLNMAGKMLVDKTPPGFKSPNLADAVVIAFSPVASSMENWIRLAE